MLFRGQTLRRWLAWLRVAAAKSYWYYRRAGLRATARRIGAELRLRLRPVFRHPARAAPSPGLFDLATEPPWGGVTPGRIAVHVHAHYPELAAEVASALANIPYPYDLFVSVTGEAARVACSSAFEGLPQCGRVLIAVVENRGRDLAPMVGRFGTELAGYDYLCHLHTKKSGHALGRMSGWREYLFDQLLGSSDQVRRIFSLFARQPDVGIIYPQNYEQLPYWANTWLSNRAAGAELCARLGIERMPDGYFDYPAGSMFWVRPAAIARLLRAGFREIDFPEEAGQTDGTLAHVIERLLVLAGRHAGFRALILRDPANPSWSKWRFDQYFARTRDDVLRALDDAAIRVVAFDVFDTLVVRPLLDPEAIKRLVAREVFSEGGEDFPALRAHAESVARARAARDVGLDEIYAELAVLSDWPGERLARLRALEEQLEERLPAPRPEAIDLYEQARQRGKRVVLVSDTFLPRALVERTLARNGIGGYDALYLSSEIGQRKDTGGLYRVLIEREKIHPMELIMIGDNEHSDAQVPVDLGIPFCHLLRPVEIARANDRFSPLLEAATPEDELVLGLIVRRFFRPLFYRAFDPATMIRDGAEGLGYAVVGPLALAFALWLRQQASADGVARLFFLAREGKLLKAVYDRMARWIPDAPASHYLVLSRRAVTVPMIESNEDIQRVAQTRYSPNDLAAFFRYRFGVELDADDLTLFAREGLWAADRPVEIKGDAGHLRPVLERMSDRILERARRERPGLEACLREAGLDQPNHGAVVDVGYAATIQGMLSKILTRPVSGYYMLTSPIAQTVAERYQVLVRTCFNGAIAGHGSNASPLWPRSFELEMLLSSDDPQVVCYEPDGAGRVQPVYQPQPPARANSAEIRAAIQRGATGFVDDFCGLRRDIDPELRVSPRLAERLFAEFVGRLSVPERKIFSALALDDHYCGRGIVGLDG